VKIFFLQKLILNRGRPEGVIRKYGGGGGEGEEAGGLFIKNFNTCESTRQNL
jgi:hypothetical protein